MRRSHTRLIFIREFLQSLDGVFILNRTQFLTEYQKVWNYKQVNTVHAMYYALGSR